MERAVGKADQLGLADPEALRAALEECERPGAATLRSLLDRRTFRLTRPELERRFLRIVDRAGLARPLTGQVVNGFEVDFYWPDLRLVVETDGLRYHRTAQQQTRDLVRDQVHTVAGLIRLRFSDAQVRFEEPYVETTMRAGAMRAVAP
jgi:very-short-patch-repair endonuclease